MTLLSNAAVDKAQANDTQNTLSASSPAVERPEGVKVSLSGEGLQKSSDEKNANPNADIESSGLPDQTQKLLKMIRELQKKIEEKQAQMQEVIADQSLSPEIKQSQVGSLQSELATLTANLMTANNTLDKQSRNGTLSAGEAQQAARLAMKKS
ncbi:hypothetical protein NRB16_09090 [Pseudomonas sp. LJDD11]|uniref:hypothetical protein n=1 Tax=unclassified Pseudomonas TaxID=196821 RepID=UPI000A9007E8|nr:MULTISPECIES: hypothetical protein [unclassified Pseudomonas]MCQ9423677.1 hypothetical protein [Pseudomonas sp. LJDD11]